MPNESLVLPLLLQSKEGFRLGILTMKTYGTNWWCILQSSLHFLPRPPRSLVVPGRRGVHSAVRVQPRDVAGGGGSGHNVVLMPFQLAPPLARGLGLRGAAEA